MPGLKLRAALATCGAVAVLAVGGMPGVASAAGEGDTAASGAAAVAAADPTTDPTAAPDPGVGEDADSGLVPDSDLGLVAPADPATTTAPSVGGMDVSPQSVAPGGEVTLRLEAACSAGRKAKASAEVFVTAVTLAPAVDGQGLEGSAFIKSDASEGSYAISVECDGETSSARASITVVAGGGALPGTPTAPVTPAMPVKPVPAGGGGTAQLAAGPATAGSSTGPLLVTGGCAAVALTGLLARRRRAVRHG